MTLLRSVGEDLLCVIVLESLTVKSLLEAQSVETD